ncbi:MAG: bifunctional riboflavin kinase/FAD synthetase [Bacteroidota bacterium]|nr:bifunctional riboflavin kinase/FAD synthetase [Bacteroidota bacterium]MDP3145514.1 bifunctional riboflavin kinase/FAD synthetase [Bacteroidota bacterium]MDP3556474.1 bifunctional riboflavin kinase/FAD synthetase [Bacteroidota bacterium]
MLIIQNTENFRIETPTIVTIGTFDGVHLGHQKILSRLKELKEKLGLKTVVLTFEPHPRKVLFPEQKDLKLITLIDEKLDLLEKYGVDIAVVYPFNKTFSQLDVKDYLEEILIRQLNVRHLVIGYDHKFGKNREGDINALIKHAGAYNFTIEEIRKKDIDNIAVSSTNIRKAIDDGKIKLATSLLGHSFFLKAKVIKGKQLGRKLGFPTANLLTEGTDKLIPKIGVYFVEVIIDNEKYFGMLNIGINPTTDKDDKVKIEVNIFDFDQDVYNKTITLNFIKRLRDEKKFDNLNELISQLNIDKETCLDLIKTEK